MIPSTEQSVALADLEQTHGRVLRVPDGAPVVEKVLERCLSDTRVYMCASCHTLFSIEPDGEIQGWLTVHFAPDDA